MYKLDFQTDLIIENKEQKIGSITTRRIATHLALEFEKIRQDVIWIFSFQFLKYVCQSRNRPLSF